MKTKKTALWIGIVCAVVLVAVIIFLAVSAGREKQPEAVGTEPEITEETEKQEESGDVSGEDLAEQEGNPAEPESGAPQEAPESDAALLYVARALP